MNLPIKKKAKIQTERLCLKPYSSEDAGRLAEFFKNDEISKTFMVPDFESEKQIEDTGHLEYGIYCDNVMIGFVNDCGIEEDTIEIGYVIHPDYKGHGYATEAVLAIVEELREMGFRKVMAGFFEENTASRRVMEKSGMQLNDLVEEEEYRGIIHKCYYCEINF